MVGGASTEGRRDGSLREWLALDVQQNCPVMPGLVTGIITRL